MCATEGYRISGPTSLETIITVPDAARSSVRVQPSSGHRFEIWIDLEEILTRSVRPHAGGAYPLHPRDRSGLAVGVPSCLETIAIDSFFFSLK